MDQEHLKVILDDIDEATSMGEKIVILMTAVSKLSDADNRIAQILASINENIKLSGVATQEMTKGMAKLLTRIESLEEGLTTTAQQLAEFSKFTTGNMESINRLNENVIGVHEYIQEIYKDLESIHKKLN